MVQLLGWAYTLIGSRIAFSTFVFFWKGFVAKLGIDLVFGCVVLDR